MYELPALPYGYDALQPAVSELTMRTHHDKHHKAYVDQTNALVGEKGEGSTPLEEIVRKAKRDGEQKLFNQSGQAWNHAFYWECMSAGGTAPQGALEAAIRKGFGSLADLKAKFVAEGAGHFASGWVWLAARGENLEVVSTHDADTLLVHEGLKPLLVCDLWEHAYYLDYKNVRKEFLETWFDKIANWGFASQQLEGREYRYPAPTA